ncbi:MAG: Phosphoserine phosphatase RsbU [Smithella sp. PtaU1.Bin162]|nr:MAG: Phosphoserine phosphatase RsbU [Smithella sp. PtaU1.Bin162]
MFTFKRGISAKGASLHHGRGIAFRLSFWILLSATLIFTLVFGYYYNLSRNLITEKIEQHAEELAKNTALRIDMVLAATQKIPQNFAGVLAEEPSWRQERLFELMRATLERNPEIYGTAVAFEPYTWDRRTEHFSPYLYREETNIVSTLINYDYFSWEWYKLPKKMMSPSWVEPYFDEGAGNIVMSTYSVPFYRTITGRKQFSGIVTIDISLAWLQKIVSEIQIGETGYAFLISQKGTYVTHPDSRLIMNKTIFQLANEKNDPQIKEIGTKMTIGLSGFVETKSLMTGKDCWLAFTPLSTSGWSLGLVLPRDELMADVSRHYYRTLLWGALGLIILFGVIVWIARSITGPLRTLTSAAENMAQGNLDMAVPAIRSTDEVGRLAGSFATMQQSLQNYIRDLTSTTAAKEKIESELKIAHDIQMGILPRTFPPFPQHTEIDIYAVLQPAREVGGDLYDFFFMDDDHLCFTVGDVSGKGVPAALLMAVTKILIKSKATRGLTPETILARVNEDLSLDNPAMMFITLFLGIMDVRTGDVLYCNGGHPNPYILHADGKIETLPTTNGMALGVINDFAYTCKTVTLRTNESLFLYSDGVTEAADTNNELFMEKRLEAVLASLQKQPLKNITDGIMEKIKAFAGDSPQADDITMMVVKYTGEFNKTAG